MSSTPPDISALNNTTFDATESSTLLEIGNGLTDTAGTYVASQNSAGDLAWFDTWDGNTAAPGATPQGVDVVSVNTVVESVAADNAPFGIVEYTFTQENGDVNPPTGGTGAEVVAWNQTGVLFEQLNGYVPGQTDVTLNGNFFIVTSQGVDLSGYDGSSGPTTAELTFDTTSWPFPTTFQCFAAGTRIACDTGERAVEELRVGDHAVLAEGGTLPIVWIGWREIDCRRHPDPDAALPLRVAPGAFGVDSPGQPLFLSPDHAVFIDDVLIPIRLLANGSTIRQMQRDTVTYYHIELERHAVILAEGLPVESFLDHGDRAWFEHATSAPRHGRKFSVAAWECLACAPLVLTGSRLARARRILSARAGLTEHPVPGLTAAADADFRHMEFVKP
jgi:hypothetical protein